MTWLKRDELFRDELETVQNAAQLYFLQQMGDAKAIIENLSSVSAKYLAEMVMTGSVGGRMIKADKQADIIMKTLSDFSGLKEPEKHLHIHADMMAKIIKAYEKNKEMEEAVEGEAPTEVKVEEPPEQTEILLLPEPV